MTAVRSLLTGQSLGARVLRSSAFTGLGFFGQQAIRFAANLILTRLLFPEAFGVMTMVAVVLTGLAMFSDVGVGPAIMQSKRGDDRDFLDTAWTIQILRGALLALAAIALSPLAAAYFDEPGLRAFLPVAALSLVIAGFNPTRLEEAKRHLRSGRITLIELCSQVSGVAVATTLAWATQSVWALVVSNLAGALAYAILLDRFLPGQRNRLRWEGEAVRELVHFGKWIFLSTVCGFAISQGDRIIVGGYLSTGEFGVYSIGYFLASFPLMLGHVVTTRVLIPIYRESPPAASRGNFLRLRRMRLPTTAGLVGSTLLLALAGPALIGLLYDPRYAVAGGIVTLVALAQVPSIVATTYDHAALAAGDSRSFFVLALVRALLIVGAMLGGLALAGFPGALAGQGIGHLLSYPVVVWLARRHGTWDPLHDAAFYALSAVLGGAVLWARLDDVAALGAMGAG